MIVIKRVTLRVMFDLRRLRIYEPENPMASFSKAVLLSLP